MKCRDCENFDREMKWCELWEMETKPSTKHCGEFIPVTDTTDEE